MCVCCDVSQLTHSLTHSQSPSLTHQLFIFIVRISVKMYRLCMWVDIVQAHCRRKNVEGRAMYVMIEGVINKSAE